MSDLRNRLWLLSDRLRAAYDDARALKPEGENEERAQIWACLALFKALKGLEFTIEFIDRSDPKGQG